MNRARFIQGYVLPNEYFRENVVNLPRMQIKQCRCETRMFDAKKSNGVATGNHELS